MNGVVWIILVALIALWTGICLGRWWKNRKKGCGGGCGSCPYSGSCSRIQDK